MHILFGVFYKTHYFCKVKTKRIALLSKANTQNYILGIGCEKEFSPSADFFTELDTFIDKHSDSYLFSAISYDLKNRIEKLESKNVDPIKFPEFSLWKAEIVVEISKQEITILQGEMNEFSRNLVNKIIAEPESQKLPKLAFSSSVSKEQYLQQIQLIQQEIQNGNIYELNYCKQYICKDVSEFDSILFFKQLTNLTKAPFSAYLSLNNHEVFCGSPERYIQKVGQKLISQPIKGTIRRGKSKEEDEFLKTQLTSDPKERSENIMITDLVRNDFSRIASKNSVHVDELCKLYTFGTVHQLISTISCEINPEIKFSDVLKATFPMGSMTGAPKISAMQLIEKFEDFKRGIYSGTIGIIEPNGNFDFNVVIRSFVKNNLTNTLSASVGGAITIKSTPENEFEECETKISKLLALFSND